MKHYYSTNVLVSKEQQAAIERNTRTQYMCTTWSEERKKRITASNFGAVIKRRESTLCDALVRRMSYSSFQGNIYTHHGLVSEGTTIKEYVLHMASTGVNVKVHRKGLAIHPVHPHIAASTDGEVKIVDQDGRRLLEVKNVLKNKPLSLIEAANSISYFCLKADNGILKLKENHNYFYQCHGQLNIFGAEWLDFVVQSENPNQIFVQRVRRDTNLWENKMLLKLNSFYFRCILPELAVPREGKVPGIREPSLNYV